MLDEKKKKKKKTLKISKKRIHNLLLRLTSSYVTTIAISNQVDIY